MYVLYGLYGFGVIYGFGGKRFGSFIVGVYVVGGEVKNNREIVLNKILL